MAGATAVGYESDFPELSELADVDNLAKVDNAGRAVMVDELSEARGAHIVHTSCAHCTVCT